MPSLPSSDKAAELGIKDIAQPVKQNQNLTPLHDASRPLSYPPSQIEAFL